MTIHQLKQWLHECALNSQVSVQQISPSETTEWLYGEDAIKHVSNRFFQIVGIEWTQDAVVKQQVIINQSEIGLLGFVVCLPEKMAGEKGNQVLIQAKIEPGNVNFAQVAPSCQATLSNLEQVHGGSKPLFANYFDDSQFLATTSLQSEQGTRFYKKRNRNEVAVIKEKFAVPHIFCWVNAKVLCQALASDYLVNTDARSVIVSTNWQDFVGQALFTAVDSFTQELKHSYTTTAEICSLAEIQAVCAQQAAQLKQLRVIPLGQVHNTQTNSHHLLQAGQDSFKVIHIAAKIAQREVTSWDQPIIDSVEQHQYTLYCGRQQSILFFLFTVWVEPGLFNLAELGPIIGDNLKHGKCVLRSAQSEEGGRFFNDTSTYSVVDIGEISTIQAGEIWLTLKQVQAYAQREGFFTNEARSAISLLLSKV